MQNKNRTLPRIARMIMLAMTIYLHNNAMDAPTNSLRETSSDTESENSQVVDTSHSHTSEPDSAVDNSFADETDDESTYYDSFNTQDYISPLYEESATGFDNEQEND